MTYKLKTTGIAASCIACIAVDPDTNQIKDFASAAVTADMTVGGGISVASGTWNGNARKYMQLATSNNVAFGTNKPTFTLSVSQTQRTVIWIGEAAGNSARVFGNSASDYFASVNTAAGGATYPHASIASNSVAATSPSIAAGAKVIFGWSLVRGGAANSSFVYSANHDGVSKVVTPKTVGSINPSYPLSFVGRRNDNATQQNDKIYAVLIFNTALTEAQFDSLQADWFGQLFEVASLAGPSFDITATTALPSFSGSASVSPVTSFAVTAGLPVFSGSANAGAASFSFSTTLPLPSVSGSFTGDTSSGTISITDLRDLTTGNLRVSETGITVIVNNISTGALVALLTGQTSTAGGDMSLSHASIIAGTQYRVTVILPDGSEGTWKYTAA